MFRNNLIENIEAMTFGLNKTVRESFFLEITNEGT